MSDRSFLGKLKERRVIRTTLLYVALLWAALQVADLLAGADIVSERAVQWLILIGAVGLPIAIVGSWFLESPWRERRWTSVAGDLVIILAVVAAAGLFAWQQWFASFTRPTVAVMPFEATDLRDDTAALGTHLALRLRTVLATQPAIRVVETSSSFDAQLDGLPIAEKASRTGADLVVTGTLAQVDAFLRLSVQIFDNDGTVVQAAGFEERLRDQAQLQNRLLAGLWGSLPLPGADLEAARRVIATCAYPDNREAIIAIAAVDAGDAEADLTVFVEEHGDAGMLQIAYARKLFRDIEGATATRKPVIQQVAMQHLANAQRLCPLTPDGSLLELANTRRAISEDTLQEHPNSAMLYRRAAEGHSEPKRASAFIGEARRLDPLGDW